MPEHIPGNILDLNTQDIEFDTSGWESDSAVLVRQELVMVNRGEDWIMVGVATGAAPIVVRTAQAFPLEVTGTPYAAYGHVFSPDRDTDVTVTAHWLDESGEEIGTLSATKSVSAGEIMRVVAVGTPPAGAVSARMSMSVSADAAEQLTAFDVMYLGPVPNRPGNLLDYEQFSVEIDTAGWYGVGADVTQIPTPHTGADGWYVLNVVPHEGTQIAEITRDDRIPVEGGRWYYCGVGCWVFAGDPFDANRRLSADVRLEWFDSSGESLGFSSAVSWFTVEPEEGDVYIGARVGETGMAPDGAVEARMSVLINCADTTATEFTADAFFIEPIDAPYEISVSNETASVQLTLDYTPPWSYERFSLYRVHSDGSRYPVRGYGGDWEDVDPPAMPLVVEDYECPLGIQVWYLARWYDTDGVGRTEVSTLPMASPVLDDPGQVWLKSPGIPALNSRVTMAAPVAWARKARAGVYEIVGRSTPVVVTDRRASREGTLSMHVWDNDSHEALNALLDSGLPALVQAMPGHGLPGNLYVHLGDASSEPLSWSAAVPGWRWSVSVREIDRPSGGLEGSARYTWEDVMSAYETWTDVADEHPTWLSVLLAE